MMTDREWWTRSVVIVLCCVWAYAVGYLWGASELRGETTEPVTMAAEVDCFVGVPLIFGQGQLPGRGNLPEFEMVIIRVVPGTLRNDADGVTIPKTPEVMVCTEHD